MIVRDYHFSIRLSKNEIDAINDLSIDMAMTKATFIRYLIRLYANRLRMVQQQ